MAHSSPPRWREPTLWLCLLAVLIAFLPPLISGQILFSGDTFYYFYPYRYTLFEALQAGYFPLWEAGVLSGNPFCANPQATCFYPPGLFFAWPDFFAAYHAALIFHLLMLGAGAYAWLRQRRHAPLEAQVATLVLLFGGLTLSLINRLDKLESLTWWPWALLGAEWVMDDVRANPPSSPFRRPSARAWMLTAALVLAFFAGGLEIWAMMVGSILLWPWLSVAGEESALALPPGAGSETAGSSPKRVALNGFVACLFALGLSLLLTAPQWLPLAELLRHSTRVDGMSFARATELSLRPADLWALLSPHLYYAPEQLAFFPSPGQASEPRYLYGLYPGLLAVLAGLLGASSLLRPGPRRREGIVALLLVLSGVLLAFGAHFPLYATLYGLLPPLRSVRYPEKFVCLSMMFALPLVAEGVKVLQRSRRARALGLLLVGIPTVLLLGAPDSGARLMALPLALSTGADPEAWAAHLLHLLPGPLVQLLALSAALLLLELGARGRLRQGLLTLAIGVLVVAELLAFNRGLNPWAPRALLASSPLSAAIAQAVPQARVHVMPLYLEQPLFDPAESVPPELAYRSLWELFYPNTAQLAGLQYADGSRALRIAEPTRYFSALRTAPWEWQLELLSRAGIEVLIARGADWQGRLQVRPELELLAFLTPKGAADNRFSGERARADDVAGLDLPSSSSLLQPGMFSPEPPPARQTGKSSLWTLHAWRLKTAAPRAYFVPTARAFESDESALTALLQGDLEPREQVGLSRQSVTQLVPCSACVQPVPQGTGPAPSAGSEPWLMPGKLQSEEGGRVKRLTPLSPNRAGFVVFPEAYYPGWQARVDGRSTPLLRANGYQQAVQVQAGWQQLELRFEPRGAFLSWSLAGLGALLCVLWFFISRPRKPER